MWATFDDNEFPKVKITFQGVPANDADFVDFLTQWDSYNTQRNNTPYVFVFDTTNVGMVNPKYALKMSDFIKELNALNGYHPVQQEPRLLLFFTFFLTFH